MKSTTPCFAVAPLFEPQTRHPWACQYRIPNLLVSKRGTIFAFPEERVNGIADESKRHLVLRRSSTNGETWSELEILYADETLTEESYSGTIMLARFNLEWLMDKHD